MVEGVEPRSHTEAKTEPDINCQALWLGGIIWSEGGRDGGQAERVGRVVSKPLKTTRQQAMLL